MRQSLILILLLLCLSAFGQGFTAETGLSGGYFISGQRPYYSIDASLGCKTGTPLIIYGSLGGIRGENTVSAATSVKLLCEWENFKVSPLAGTRFGWAFQLPVTREVTDNCINASKAVLCYSPDGPFFDFCTGASIRLGQTFRLRLMAAFGYAVFYRGAWGREEGNRSVRYGLTDQRPSGTVWIPGRSPLKLEPFLTLSASFCL